MLDKHNSINKTFIIAEAGVNHNGDLALAKKMIDAAVDFGVDAIKFQTAIPEMVVTSNAKKAEYQIAAAGNKIETQLEMIKRISLPLHDFKEIKEYCDNKKIIFLSTAFDLESLKFLDNLGLQIHKVPSGEINNLPYLRKVAECKKPVILSTGMSNLGEIERAFHELVTHGVCADEITILHCNTEYPTPMEDVNLKAMQTIKNAFDVRVGYSDHTQGIEVSIAAVAMGATIIEKHFTLDRSMVGPDHKASLEPAEFALMVKSIRNIDKALGNGIKIVSFSEKKNIEIARRSIVALVPINRGDVFTEINLTTKRPGNGLSPISWDFVLGRRAIRDFAVDELIEI
jgi:N,N'-diacetyllegionaminate synthase